VRDRAARGGFGFGGPALADQSRRESDVTIGSVRRERDRSLRRRSSSSPPSLPGRGIRQDDVRRDGVRIEPDLLASCTFSLGETAICEVRSGCPERADIRHAGSIGNMHAFGGRNMVRGRR
jgi:hypothetical protein